MLNNPLKYSDPSGEFIVSALIGAAVSVLVNGISNMIAGQPFFQNWGMAAITGFIGGAIAPEIGNFAEKLKGFTKFAHQTFAHAYLGAFMTAFSGGNPLHGAIAGALGSMVGAGAGELLSGVKNEYVLAGGIAFSGGIAGGIGSAISGGSFWDGFRNGFISAGLNHALHLAYQRTSLIQMIKKAGYDPYSSANINENEIKVFAKKVFGKMYIEAGSPPFKIMDNLPGSAMGLTKVRFILKNGKAISVSHPEGIYLKKAVLTSYYELGSTIGHELSHIIFDNKYGVAYFNISKEYWRAATEVYAHAWEYNVQSPFYNPSRQMSYMSTILKYINF